MVAHPPFLYLGYVGMTIPFGLASAALLVGRLGHEFLRPLRTWLLLPWTFLTIAIVMGGWWAYEVLGWGGYWAWDPVENMSLVPWIVLVAGIHTNLIARNTGHSIRSAYIFYILTFLFIIYSTFLTRSGVLGDTSVHAFTEMGLEWQLIGFIALFLLLWFSRFVVASLSFMLSSGAAWAQQCLYSEPAADHCQAPRVIPGTVGHHVVQMDATSATDIAGGCTVSYGKTVWFEVVPEVRLHSTLRVGLFHCEETLTLKPDAGGERTRVGLRIVTPRRRRWSGRASTGSGCDASPPCPPRARWTPCATSARARPPWCAPTPSIRPRTSVA